MIIALLILVIILVGANSSDTSGSPEPTAPTSISSPTAPPTAVPPTATPEPTATPVLMPGLGATTEVSGSEYTVNSFRDPAPPRERFEVEDGHRPVAFDVSQKALEDGESYNVFDFEMQDKDGFRWSSKPLASALQPSYRSGELNAGQSTRGWVAFSLPEGTEVTSLMVEGKVFGPSIVIADLASSDALRLYDADDNGRITCAEAESHKITPVGRHHPAYEHMDDRNEDGIVCE